MTSLELRPGEPVLVSSCLLGVYARYDGGTEADDRVLALARRLTVIPVCPEQLGGLSTPREPVELRCGRAVTQDGRDLTDAFRRGALEVERIARLTGARVAVLQPRSPSCGIGEIYDGSFRGVRIPGFGILASHLNEMGVLLLAPDEVATLRV